MPTNEEKRKFSSMVENLCEKEDISYIDAILHICATHEIEEQVAASLLSQSLKSKITEEAEGANLIKYTKSSRLPI